MFSTNYLLAESYCFKKLSKGEKAQITTRGDYFTCTHTSCQVCTDSRGWYASWVKCGGYCVQNNTTQNEPLTLVANFPFPNGGTFTKQSFFLDIYTNKIASIELVDNVNDKIVNLCPNCMEYKKSHNFKQGFNDITIRANKGFDFKETRITFTIDNQKPRITKTTPAMNKFANGEFSIWYDENNIKKVELYYGTPGNMIINEISCTSGKKMTCTTNADISMFEGQQINYYFVINDIADNSVSSKSVKVYVDRLSPVINSFEHSVVKGYAIFNLSVSDAYLYKTVYYDNEDIRAKILCSSFRNGICFKKLSFRKGNHVVRIEVQDKAMNTATRTIEFEIV